MKRWMIYGANGYTGRLIAREAKRRGISPILAGRNSEEIQARGKELDLEVKIFDLNEKEVYKNLIGVTAVLHCAGPFSSTHKPMYQACLKAKTHYLDITGEIQIFEEVQSKREEIKEAGIVVIPGVGLDVVPSDCLAAMLAREMPDATHLNLGIKMEGKTSPGTTKTLIEGLPSGGLIRKDGKLTAVKAAFKIRKIQFDEAPETAVTVPWADISTVFHSTGVPNTEVYLAASRSLIGFFKAVGPIQSFLALSPIQKGLKKLSEHFVTGATEMERASHKISFWGEIINARGQKIEKRIQTQDGYDFTVESTLSAIELVLRDEVRPGPWTPSKAFGADFITRIKGVNIL